MPTTRAAIAAAAQKFDDGLPAATKTSAFRRLPRRSGTPGPAPCCPAMPKPVRSSRLR